MCCCANACYTRMTAPLTVYKYPVGAPYIEGVLKIPTKTFPPLVLLIKAPPYKPSIVYIPASVYESLSTPVLHMSFQMAIDMLKIAIAKPSYIEDVKKAKLGAMNYVKELEKQYHSAHLIWNTWKEAYASPNRRICRLRLIKEYEELVNEDNPITYI